MKTKSKANLLLIELILAILFFSISVSICIRLIFTAHSLGIENEALTKGTITADSVLTAMEDNDSAVALKRAYPNLIEKDNGYVIYFDNNFKNINDAIKNGYTLTVDEKKEGNLNNIHLKIVKNNEKGLLDLNTSYYERGGLDGK